MESGTSLSELVLPALNCISQPAEDYLPANHRYLPAISWICQLEA